MTDPIRIANCSGFYGDRLSAAKEMTRLRASRRTWRLTFRDYEEMRVGNEGCEKVPLLGVLLFWELNLGSFSG